MAFDIRVEQLDLTTAVVAIEGALTLGTNLKTADSVVQGLITGGASRIVMDLHRCGYADSAGLGFLVHTNGLAEAQGGAMRICAVSERVMSLLKLTFMDRVLKVDPDRATSLLALNGG